MFAAAIFDMDGLLLDSERCQMHAWLDAARMLGVVLTEKQYLYTVGRNAPESRAWLTRVLGGSDVYGRVRQQVQALIGGEDECVFPLKTGAIDLLGQLKAMRVPCAVASSTYRPEIERRLAAVDALSFFSAVAGSDEVARGKPDPAVYQLAARRIDVEPSVCLVFEDSETGATAALNAGMSVIIVPDLITPRLAGALATLPSLAAAAPHLEGWFAG